MVDNTEFPKQDISDITYSLMISAGKIIPVAGPVIEFLSGVVDRPINQRQREYIENIRSMVVNLSERLEEYKIENLTNNPSFLSAFLYGGQIAIRNHQIEKLEALRNAVINTALPNSIDESQQQIFLNLIDTFSEWHLRVLKYFDNPVEWGKIHGVTYPTFVMGSSSRMLESAFPDLAGKRSFYDQMVNDLHDRGLLNSNKDFLHTNVSDLLAPHTSDIGKLFLKFIESPIDSS